MLPSHWPILASSWNSFLSHPIPCLHIHWQYTDILLNDMKTGRVPCVTNEPDLMKTAGKIMLYDHIEKWGTHHPTMVFCP